jgi:hypothetical protein
MAVVHAGRKKNILIGLQHDLNDEAWMEWKKKSFYVLRRQCNSSTTF